MGPVLLAVIALAVVAAAFVAYTAMSSPADCVASPWTEWSDCNAGCGGGQQFRTRTVTTPNDEGGAPCGPLNEERACNEQPCPDDCKVSDWSPWGDCTKNCGGGVRTRTRTVTEVAVNDGRPCPALTQSESCNRQPCPVDCEVSAWSPWAACSNSCGDGVQKRTRTVQQKVLHGGKGCPDLEQTKQCNVKPCPVDCKVGGWGEWAPCDAVCGEGNQSRSRPVTTQPAHGGKACPVLTESKACNAGPCYKLGKKYTDLQSADACPAGYAAIDDKVECDKAMNALKPGLWFFARGTPGNTAGIPEDLDDLKTLGGRVGSAGMAKGCSYVRRGTNPNYEEYYFNSDTGKTSEYAYGTKGDQYVTPFCKRVRA